MRLNIIIRLTVQQTLTVRRFTDGIIMVLNSWFFWRKKHQFNHIRMHFHSVQTNIMRSTTLSANESSIRGQNAVVIMTQRAQILTQKSRVKQIKRIELNGITITITGLSWKQHNFNYVLLFEYASMWIIPRLFIFRNDCSLFPLKTCSLIC